MPVASVVWLELTPVASFDWGGGGGGAKSWCGECLGWFAWFGVVLCIIHKEGWLVKSLLPL